jgi:hypothetical protein
MPSRPPERVARSSSPWHALAWVVACAMPTACSDTSSKGGGADPGGKAPEVANYSIYIGSYAAAECDREIRCGENALHKTVEACLSAIPANLDRQRKAIAASITSGKSQYSPTDAQACLDAVRAPCTGSAIDILSACNKVVSGKVALGQACVGHFECEDVPVVKGYGPYCFNGCKGLFGEEDPQQAGVCVAESPVQTPTCRDQNP